MAIYDGGLAIAGDPASAGFDLNEGDWVWRYPQK